MLLSKDFVAARAAFDEATGRIDPTRPAPARDGQSGKATAKQLRSAFDNALDSANEIGIVPYFLGLVLSMRSVGATVLVDAGSDGDNGRAVVSDGEFEFETEWRLSRATAFDLEHGVHPGVVAIASPVLPVTRH